MSSRWLVLGLAASAALTACRPSALVRESSLPYYTDATFTPHWIGEDSTQVVRAPRVASFALTDQHGALVTDTLLTGRVAVVNFFYTHCGDICPLTMARLQSIAAAYATDDRVVLLSHSVTPAIDSAARLAAFADSKHLTTAHWHLLTGADSTLHRLAHADYHLLPDDATSWGVDAMAHTERVLLIDQAGRIRGVYNGTLALEMDNLRTDLERLLGAR